MTVDNSIGASQDLDGFDINSQNSKFEKISVKTDSAYERYKLNQIRMIQTHLMNLKQEEKRSTVCATSPQINRPGKSSCRIPSGNVVKMTRGKANSYINPKQINFGCSNSQEDLKSGVPGKHFDSLMDYEKPILTKRLRLD